MRIYLDHASTTPLAPAARARMVAAMATFGNPSSPHTEGRAAREIADRCRSELIRRANQWVAGGEYEFSDVVFTSGGTEAANLALIGRARASGARRIAIAAAEHSCVHGSVALLRRLGVEVEVVPVDRYGRIVASPDADVRVIMAANNELGTVNDLGSGAGLLSDGVQAFGKLPFAVRPDALWVSAHKIGGPKGVGALLLAPGVRVEPLVAGGEQERERRGGTENTIGLAGFLGAMEEMDDLEEAGCAGRDIFWDALVAGGGVPSVPERAGVLKGHAHFRFPGVRAEVLLARLDLEGVAASPGAACSAGATEPSHVLRACGYSDAEAREGVRFSFGRGNSVEEGERAAEIVLRCVRAIRR